MASNDPTLRRLGSSDAPDSVEYEYDAETPASIAVIHAICALTDVDPLEAPTELGFVLHEHVDPGALDKLIGGGTGDGETVVSFEISNGKTYAVDVSDDGCIEIRRAGASG